MSVFDFELDMVDATLSVIHSNEESHSMTDMRGKDPVWSLLTGKAKFKEPVHKGLVIISGF